VEAPKVRLLAYELRADPLLEHDRASSWHVKVWDCHGVGASWMPAVDDDFVTLDVENVILIERTADLVPAACTFLKIRVHRACVCESEDQGAPPAVGS
jgi:hypothetical protein